MQRRELLLAAPLKHERHVYAVGCQVWLLGVIWNPESVKGIVNVGFPALQWNSLVYLVL